MEASTALTRTRIFPYFVGSESGEVAFKLYRDRGHSSAYAPNERYREHFLGDAFAVEREIRVAARRLDDVYRDEDLSTPDYMKLDTQGSELDILRGGARLLEEVAFVEAEVEFTHIYQDQPLFFDVAKFLYERGFELLYLNRVFGNRRLYQGPARGQIVFADALFARREDRLDGLDLHRIARYVLLLLNYGHHDLAYHVISLFPGVRELVPNVERHFERRPSRMRTVMIRHIDRLCSYWLKKRRTNQDVFDSDRAWPFR